MRRPSALALAAGLCLLVLSGCGEDAAQPTAQEAAQPAAPAPQQPSGAELPTQALLLFHRATYDMRLRSARPGAEIADVRGTMTTEFADVCDGYTFSQTYQSQFTDPEGTVRSGELRVTTFESRDGTAFRFSMRNEIDETVVETAVGRATGGPGSGPGEVRYDDGEPKTVVLPAATLFPTEFALALIRAAQAGERRATATLFDGAADRKIFNAYAAIGPVKTDWPGQDLAQVPGAEELPKLVSWPVSVSYFPLGSKDDLPDYEASFRMFPNGATSDLVLNFGDYVIVGRLTKIEPLRAPQC